MSKRVARLLGCSAGTVPHFVNSPSSRRRSVSAINCGSVIRERVVEITGQPL
jgi:hypothetical protein